MNSWQSLTPTLLILIYTLTAIVQFLKWLWLWQKKDYRLDKMRDYLTLPESRPIVFDYWFKLRIISLGYIIFEYLFSLNLDWLNYFFVGAWCIEIAHFILKLITRKKVLIPHFTPKATIITILGLIVIGRVVLISVLFNTPIWSLFIFTLDLLLMPVTVGFCIICVLPIDYVSKKRLFNRAILHRETLTELKVVAVSGAFGKTTTKEVLTFILDKKLSVESTSKNQNTDISCARKSIQLKRETDYFICEVGAINVGDGDRIAKIIQPQTAIITGLNEQHFGLFGSLENIIKAETESLAHLKENDLVIVNWSSELCHRIQFPKGLKVIKCGIDIVADYQATDVQFTGNQTTFTLKYRGTSHTLKTNLLSRGSVQNILHVIAFCLENRIFTVEELTELLLDLPNPDGRLEVYNRDFGQIIFNQYNNYDGILNVLDFTKKQKNLVVFLDDIVELGSMSKEIHQKLGKELAQCKPKKVVLMGRNFAGIVEKTLLENGIHANQILMWNGQNTSQIKTQIKAIFQNNKPTTILLLGYLSKTFLDI